MTRNDNKARQWGPVPGCGLESSRRRESAGQSLSINLGPITLDAGSANSYWLGFVQGMNYTMKPKEEQ